MKEMRLQGGTVISRKFLTKVGYISETGTSYCSRLMFSGGQTVASLGYLETSSFVISLFFSCIELDCPYITVGVQEFFIKLGAGPV